MAIPNKEQWKATFAEVFEELEDEPIASNSHGSFYADNPLVYNTKGEAMYKCGKCGRKWQSINALVEFEYRLSERDGEHYGDVTLSLNGQKCKANACKLIFVKPAFTNDGMQYCLEKLLVKIKEKFYGEDVSERLAKMNLGHNPAGRGTHIPALCEGCQKGICHSGATNEPRGRPGPGGYYGRGNSDNFGRELVVEWILMF